MASRPLASVPLARIAYALIAAATLPAAFAADDPQPAGADASGEPSPTPTPPPSKLAEEAALDFVEVPTGVEAQPTLKMFLRLPDGLPPDREALDLRARIETSEDDREPPAGVLVYLTWKTEPASLVQIATSERSDLVAWAREHRLAIVVFDVHKHWRTHWSYDRLDRSELRKQDNDFDLLTKAFRRGMDEFTRRHQLPEDGYLLYGISGGAHWGHRLAMRLPERFLAAHVHVANSYDKPERRANEVIWLVTTGDMDSGAAAARRFYDDAYALGYPIVFKMGRALGHSDRSDIRELGLRFFDHVLALESEYGARQAPGPWAGSTRSRSRPG